jgi:L-fucose isomerase-like protein
MTIPTIGVIFGNRDFFPTQLVAGARRDVQQVFAELGIQAVMLGEDQTTLGSVETYDHAKQCAELFKKHRDQIDGILVVLPNFGDEKGVAETLKLSGLQSPVLVQAYPDDLDALNLANRRDAYCGKISVCNNLTQYGLAFSLTDEHTVHPLSDSFKQDLRNFLGVCRVVKGLGSARLGAIGARPSAFNTVRYSEKLLQATGISVTTVDFSEILGEARRLSDDDGRVKAKLEEVGAYARHDKVPSAAMLRIAKLGVAIGDWMAANDLVASAIQCWTSLQRNYGVNVCTLMSMMSDRMMPSACEVDVTGVISMYALQLASLKPAALVDWNNNYGSDPDRCVFFHCGNWARTIVPDLEISTAPILGTTIGEENTYGALAGRAPSGPITFARVSTDDRAGRIRAYVGEGQMTDDPLDTFGNRAVVHIERLKGLMKHICKSGYEHHVAMTLDCHAGVLEEAFTTYMGWETHNHTG